MFDFHSAFDNASMVIEDNLMLKNNEAGFARELVKLADGRLTKCGPTELPYAILERDFAAGIDVTASYLVIRKDCRYKADVINGNLLAGQTAVAVSADGSNLDAANVATGKVEIVGYDPNTKRSIIKFNI